MKTIWQTEDRQGYKFFSEKPRYSSIHDIFIGKSCSLPKNRKLYRLIKNFQTKIIP